MVDVSPQKTNELLHQIRILEKAGSALIRISTPTIADVKAIEKLKQQHSISVPLVADTHHSSAVAEAATEVFDKVRINPGNFLQKTFANTHIYTDKEYDQELQRIENSFVTLLNQCKQRNVVLRIGANHGSLSGRILSRHGNTVTGSVESVMEFLRIAQHHNFPDIVVSIKSSDTRTMIAAYRTLAQQMTAEKMSYPLHLGVTEAGADENGRIKSAIGIGTLLLQGIGHTIRVSLTEPPENEIPVAQQIITNIKSACRPALPFEEVQLDKKPTGIFSNPQPVVILYLNKKQTLNNEKLISLGYHPTAQKWQRGNQSPDIIWLESQQQLQTQTTGLTIWLSDTPNNRAASNFYKVTTIDNLQKITNPAGIYRFDSNLLENVPADIFQHLRANTTLIIGQNTTHYGHLIRRFVNRCIQAGVLPKIIFQKNKQKVNTPPFLISASIHFGGLLVDNIGNGICFRTHSSQENDDLSIIFGILQSSGVRSSKTELIACPGCGRTLFNLQKAYKQVYNATQHLTGLKIAVMGCIVNGLGEMADADYGYVGASTGKINIYRNKTLVKRNIDEEHALNELISVIKADKKWPSS